MKLSGGLFVIVLNYQRPEDTLECLSSLKSSDMAARVVLVDNASMDGCVPRVRECFPEVHVIENEMNLGYAEGNNRGIRWAMDQGADWVLVLNNDTTVRRSALRLLVEGAQKNPKAGILAPKVLYYDKPEIVNSCGTDMDWIRLRPKLGYCDSPDRDPWKGKRESAVFPGSALLLTRELLEKAGSFDPDYFLVHEDADLCYASRKSGFKNVLVPEAVVYHKVSRVLSADPFLGDYYSTRNFLAFSARHANLQEKTQVFIGLGIFLVWNAIRYPFSSARQKCKIRGFYLGVADYFRGKNGALEDRS